MDKIADELAIRDLEARYVDAIHRRDADAWAATWSDDAVWILPALGAPDRQRRFTGRAAIRAAWVDAMAGFSFVAHMVHSGHIDWLEADEAVGRWYLSEHLHSLDGAAVKLFGVYEDRYGKSQGRWRFAQRRFHVLNTEILPPPPAR